jgi:hypothetical protein
MLNEFEDQVKAIELLTPVNAANGQQAITGITAAELMQKIFPEPRWAIPGILPEGLNLLAGKPKKGKSIFALNIGLSIALGGLTLGKIPVEQGAVMYLALEDTERRLQGRLRQMMSYSDQAPATLHLFTKWPRMGAGGLELLEAKISEIPNIRLIIIDTLQKFRNPTKGNANIYVEDYETVTKIKMLLTVWASVSSSYTTSEKPNLMTFLTLFPAALGSQAGQMETLLWRVLRGTPRFTSPEGMLKASSWPLNLILSCCPGDC